MPRSPWRQLWLADRQEAANFDRPNTCSLPRRHGYDFLRPDPNAIRPQRQCQSNHRCNAAARQSVARMPPLHDCKILPLRAQRAVHSFSGRTAMK